MDIPLRYGDGTLRLRIPDRNVAGVYRPRPPEQPVSLSASLANTPAAGKLRDESRGRRALFLVSDATRDVPHGEILTVGLEALAGAAEITVGVATGSHFPDTPGNRALAATAIDVAGRVGAPRPRVVVHDADAADPIDHGETSRGTPIRVSPITEDFDLLLVASDVKFHYFAGYSNPIKFVLPGLAARASIERNHSLALEPGARFGHHPWHPDPSRRENPVAEDMLEAWKRVLRGRPAHALVTVSAGGATVHAALGPAERVTREAMAAADARAELRVPAVRRVVVSAGGAPTDGSLYLAQRAVELTKAAVADGGELLFVAECRDGIGGGNAGREHFWNELARPLPEVRERISRGYRLYQHKAFRFAELLERLERVWLASSLADTDVRPIHLEPAREPQAVVDGWIADDPGVAVAFFDEANRLGVVA